MEQEFPSVGSANGTRGAVAESGGEGAPLPSGAPSVPGTSEELDLEPDALLTLQTAIQGLPLPDCVVRARRFLEACQRRR